jgi:hypothetical protein
MKAFYSRVFTPWWIAALSMLVIAGCGSDSNPISPTSANINQVNSVNSKVPSNVFSATLIGSEEVPPVNSAATGTGVVIVDPNTRTMKATIVTADIAGTAAHINVAPRGVAGPIVLPLTESSAGSGIWSISATLTTDQLTQLQNGNYYFNVYSAAFPDGEIRGQITASLPQSGSTINTGSMLTSTGATGVNAITPGTTNSTTTISGTDMTGTAAGSSGTGGTTAGGNGTTATNATNGSGTSSTNSANPMATSMRPVFYTNVLSGSLVVPPTSSTATGTAITVLRPRDNTLLSVIITNGITGTGASLRQATPTAIGPVVATLNEVTPKSGIWFSRVPLSSAQITALNAGNFYYEVTSAAFPEGEIRGQVIKTSGTSTVATTGTGSTTGGTSATTGTATTGATTPTTPTTPTTTGTTTGTGTGTTTPTTTGTTTGTATTTPTTTGTTTGAGTTVPTTTVTTTGTGTTTPTTTGTTTQTSTTTPATVGSSTLPTTGAATIDTTGTYTGTSTVTPITATPTTTAM